MKIIIILLAFIYICFSYGITVSAEDVLYIDEDLFAEDIEDEFGEVIDEISGSVPQEAEEFIAEHNIEIGKPDEMLAISPADVLSYAFEKFKENLALPLKTLTVMFAVILLSSVAEGLGDTANSKQLSKTYGIVSVLVAVGVITKPLADCINYAASTIYSGGNFMLTYIPVFAGVTASAGNVSSGVAYNMLIVAVAEAAVQLTSSLLIPALSVCMALGIVEAVNPSFNLTGITAGIKKASTFILGFIMTIFIGLLSLQSVLGTSVDTLGIKTAKFMAANLIPVVGNAVADAYMTVRSSLGLLKSGVGFFGVIALFLTVLPAIMQVIAMRLVFAAGEIGADLFGTSRLKTLFKNTSDILALMLSLLCCFTVMFVLSTIILMITGLSMN